MGNIGRPPGSGRTCRERDTGEKELGEEAWLKLPRTRELPTKHEKKGPDTECGA